MVSQLARVKTGGRSVAAGGAACQNLDGSDGLVGPQREGDGNETPGTNAKRILLYNLNRLWLLVNGYGLSSRLWSCDWDEFPGGMKVLFHSARTIQPERASCKESHEKNSYHIKLTAGPFGTLVSPVRRFARKSFCVNDIELTERSSRPATSFRGSSRSRVGFLSAGAITTVGIVRDRRPARRQKVRCLRFWKMHRRGKLSWRDKSRALLPPSDEQSNRRHARCGAVT
jgi:hypothetical protein